MTVRRRPGANQNIRQAACNSQGVEDLLETAKVLGMPIRLGCFAEDPPGYRMARRLERALDEQ
jgi:hypothetical protein